MRVTGIINEIDGKLAPEFLGKFSKDQQKKLIIINKQKSKVIQDELKKLREEREKLGKLPTIQQIDISEDVEKARLDEINRLYSINGPKQKISSDNNGNIVAEHKNSLGFIFIGDSLKYSKDPKVLVSSPKISMAVGGVLLANSNPESGETVDIDPRKDELLGVASQFHLFSLTDIDVKGIFSDNVSTLKKRSSVKAEADVLELYSNEVVLIRSLGRPYKSATGARTLTPGGVHIISGMNYEDSKTGTKAKIKEPEPMVLGKALAETLSEIVTKISDINSVLINMNEDILKLKLSLIAHTHVATSFASPTTPSVDLAISVAPTVGASTVKNIANTYSHLVNLELLKTNSLTPLSERKFLSEYNRVN